MTKEEEKKFHIAYQWWALSVTELRPFLTETEWLKMAVFSRDILKRTNCDGDLGDYSRDDDKWPDSHEGIWDAKK